MIKTILITTYYLDNFSGSEKYTLEWAAYLHSQGWKVFIYSPNLGLIAKEFSKEIQISDDIKVYRDVKFSVIHAHHNITAILARSFFPHTPIIFVCHGTEPILEQPPSLDIGISRYVAISEEVSLHLQNIHGIEAEKISIIRNFYKITKNNLEIPKKVHAAVVISNHYSDSVKEIIAHACNHLKIPLRHIGRPNNVTTYLESEIEKVDLVFSLGKGALESAALGRHVIIYDKNGYDGILTPRSYDRIKACNFSGRALKKPINADLLIQDILSLDVTQADNLRKIIHANHDIDVAFSAFEALYRKVFSESVICPQRNNFLQRELIFLLDMTKKSDQKMTVEKKSLFYKIISSLKI